MALSALSPFSSLVPARVTALREEKKATTPTRRFPLPSLLVLLASRAARFRPSRRGRSFESSSSAHFLPERRPQSPTRSRATRPQTRRGGTTRVATWHHHLACARRRRNLTLEEDTRGIGHGAGERTRAARYVPTSRHALSARARVRARATQSRSGKNNAHASRAVVDENALAPSDGTRGCSWTQNQAHSFFISQRM